MSVLMVFQLFLSVVITNTLYSVNLAKFENACSSLNEAILFSVIPIDELLSLNYLGINEANFESAIQDYLEINLKDEKIIVSFHYYNQDESACDINQCNSVQMRVKSKNTLLNLEKEYNYEVRMNN